MLKIVLLVSALSLCATSNASDTQPMLHDDDSLLRGSVNQVAMSGSGRYIMWGSFYESNGPGGIFVRDIKTQTTERITTENFNNNYYAISDSGSHLTYVEDINDNEGNKIRTLKVNNRTTHQIRNVSTSISSSAMAVSDYGDVAFIDSDTNTIKISLHNSSNLINLNHNGDIKGFSADGRYLVYLSQYESNSYKDKVYLYDTIKKTQTNISYDQNGQLATGDVGNAAISADGSVIYYRLGDFNDSVLYKYYLSSGERKSFNLDALHVYINGQTGYKSLSVSYNGQYVSFVGGFQITHPEMSGVSESDYADSGTRERVLRLDTLTGTNGTIKAMSKSYNGEYFDGFINNVSFISNDGRMATFCTAADNILNRSNTTAEEPYHAYSSAAHSSSFMFAELIHSDANWAPYNPMRLVDHFTWEGEVTVNGYGEDSFKIDIGGRWYNGQFQSTFSDGTSAPYFPGSGTYGDSNGDNKLDKHGSAININSGPGTYTIRFYEIGKTYTITPKAIMEENFDSGITWKTGGTYNGESTFPWKRESYSTPSSYTGPSAADDLKYYAYMETSYNQGAYYNGDVALLESPSFNSANTTLSFSYHKYGSNMGDLFVDVQTSPTSSWQQVWASYGANNTSHNDDWNKAHVNLSGYGSNAKVRLRGVAKGGWKGDMAIDNIKLFKHTHQYFTYQNPEQAVGPYKEHRILGYSKTSGQLDFYELAASANQFCRQQGYRGYVSSSESYDSSGQKHAYFDGLSWAEVSGTPFYKLNTLTCGNTNVVSYYNGVSPSTAPYYGSVQGYYNDMTADQFCKERGHGAYAITRESGQTYLPYPLTWWNGSTWATQQPYGNYYEKIIDLTCSHW